MKTIKQAVAKIKHTHDEITQLLNDIHPESGSATYDIMSNSISVRNCTTRVLAADLFTQYDLNSVIGSHGGFWRHLAEVEQSVWKEIGDEHLDRLKVLYKESGDNYHEIYLRLCDKF